MPPDGLFPRLAPPASEGAIKGISNATDLGLKFDNYTIITSPHRVAKGETTRPEIGTLIYLHIPYVVRGPSGALPANRPPRRKPLFIRWHPVREGDRWHSRDIGRPHQIDSLAEKARRFSRFGAE